jgi:hypothetical protein
MTSELQKLNGLLVPVPEDIQVITGCSDERFPTDESAAIIDERHPGAMNLFDGYARYWGGVYGTAAGAMIAACMREQGAGITENGGFDGTVEAIDAVTDGRMARHSDEKSEGNPLSICQHGKLGCLLCEKLGAALMLLASDETVQDTARQDIHDLYLDSGTERFDALVGGVRLFAESLPLKSTGDGAADLSSFHIPRAKIAQDIARGKEFMVLSGPHAPIRRNRAAINFCADTVTNPRAAWEADTPFFGVDFTTVSDEIGPLVRDRDMFNWEDFAIATSGLTTAVRAALVAHDSDPNLQGKFDPKPLAVGHMGNPADAILYLTDRWR